MKHLLIKQKHNTQNGHASGRKDSTRHPHHPTTLRKHAWETRKWGSMSCHDPYRDHLVLEYDSFSLFSSNRGTSWPEHCARTGTFVYLPNIERIESKELSARRRRCLYSHLRDSGLPAYRERKICPTPLLFQHCQGSICDNFCPAGRGCPSGMHVDEPKLRWLYYLVLEQQLVFRAARAGRRIP